MEIFLSLYVLDLDAYLKIVQMLSCMFLSYCFYITYPAGYQTITTSHLFLKCNIYNISNNHLENYLKIKWLCWKRYLEIIFNQFVEV